MADKKISALTGASTPLAGTEVLPIVQSDATVKVAVSDLTAGRAVSVLSLTSTNDASINGLTVGKGAGSVATNVVLGVGSFAANSTGAQTTSIGSTSLPVATGSYNQAFGTFSGFSTVGGTQNTYLGRASGYTNISGNTNVYIGDSAGYLATGTGNTFVGESSGTNVTSGAKNSILGKFNGNQGGLDMRTLSNYVVLSDGDGNPRAYHNGSNWVFPTANLVVSNGNGIDFSATPGTGTSELFADYEEGTWTPVGTFTTQGTASTSNLNAYYTKVGRAVTLLMYITVSKGTAVGTFTVTGIPYAPATSAACACRIDGMGSTLTVVAANITSTTMNFSLMNQSTAYSANVTAAAMATDCYIQVTCTYNI